MQPTPGQSNQSIKEVTGLRAQVAALKQQLSECEAERDSLRNAQQSFRAFSDQVRDYAFITFAPDTTISSWSAGAERMFGYSEAEVLGKSGSIIFTPEDRAAGADVEEMKTAEQTGCAEDERWHIRKDGTRFWASGIMTAHSGPNDRGDPVKAYSKVLRNLTARKLETDRLAASGQQLRLFIENVRDYALVPVDRQGNVCGWNSGAERTFGYMQNEIIGKSAAAFFTPEDAGSGASEKDLLTAAAQGRAEDERWMVRKDGSRFWARWVTTPMLDSTGELHGFAKVLRDESGKKDVEDRLKASLQEKEVLLREIHHRVKNNLQVVTSLISLQAGRVSEEPVLAMFDELQDRVRAIATLHETLYASTDLAQVELGPYLEHLLNDLQAVHEFNRDRVEIHLESNSVVLSMEEALPLGLIVNELATNALKYAFPSSRTGRISVILRQVQEACEDTGTPGVSCCELTVQDDGIGIVDLESFWSTNTMGLQIVRLLTRQLRGDLAVHNTTGTTVSIRFPIAP